MLARIAIVVFMMSIANAMADEAAGEPLHYQAAFFAQFAPRTALDMLRHLPGFTLREVNAERRGFGGAVGNVLIDGKQPGAKSQSLEDILQRIPADQVVRIELWRGPQTAGTASAESVLANVVRTPSAGAGVWSAGFEYANQHEPAPNGYVSWAGRVGRTEYGIGARGYSLERNLPATRRLLDGSGELLEVRQESSPREFDERALDGEVTRDLFGGALRATGQVYRSGYRQANTLDYMSADGAWIGDERAPYRERKRTHEFGVSYRVPWGTGKFDVTAVHGGEEFTSAADNSVRSIAWTGQSSARRRLRSEETIVRATIERGLTGSHRLQIGSEAALNTLDADLDVQVFADGMWVPDDVLNGRVRVEERRAESFIVHAWQTGAWATETRLAAEYSRLDFTGDAQQSVDLTYVKPSLQLSRTFGREHQVLMRVGREVGQLDFTDFASAVSLSDDLIEGGNPDLRPQTAWRVELALDLRLGSHAAFAARVYHDWIDDAIDLVRLEGTDIAAPANIGRGTLDGMQLNLAVPLRRWIPGGSLKIDSTFQRATVTDPVTGRERPMSDFERNLIKAEFRQDIGVHGWAWGLNYSYESSITNYRMDETDRKRKSPSLDVYCERDFVRGTKLRVSVVSVQGSPEQRTRRFYEPDRAGALVRVEEMRAYPGRWLTVALDGKF